MVKLFLKRPEQSQGLVQKVLTASTAENDNPDIRDRAYVYWRLLSSDPQVTKNIVLAERPPIHTTIQSLPPALLDELLKELSTLASVYHKPPAAFLGQGRFGSDAVQEAAIEEQRQNARENPIAAAAAAAAVSGNAPAQPASNVENLLDIDFDGSAPASLQKQPVAGISGLEGLAGTPQRVMSPEPGQASSSNVDALADLFGSSNGAAAPAQSMPQNSMDDDLMNGFASLGMTPANKQPPPPSQQLHQTQGQSSKDDLVDLI